MKKKLIMLLAVLTATISTYADNTLSATGSIAKASGSTGTLVVSMTNDVAIKGVQFTLNLPEGIKVAEVKGYIPSTRADGFIADYTANNGKVTLNTSNATIAAGEGEILTFTIEATKELSAGEQYLTLTGVVLSWGGEKTEQITIPSIDYELEITDGVILSEESTIIPAAQKSVDVTVKRTLNANVWNTICLPFATTTTALSEAIGDVTGFCVLNSYNSVGSTITLGFSSHSGDIPANYPLLVKTTEPKKSFTMNSVDLAPNESDAASQSKVQTGSTIKTDAANFIGTLRAGTTIPADNIFLGTDNKFYYSDGKTNTIKGFRGYFWLKDFKSSAGARQLKLMVDGEETTAIEGLYINVEPATVEGVYNLKGQRVDTPTQKGVYIKDGKKVVIK